MLSISSCRALRPLLVVSVLLAGCAAPPPGPVTAVPTVPTVPAAPVSTTAPLAFDCRDVDAQVLIDGTVAHLPTRACRDGSGEWQIAQDDDNPNPPGMVLVYDPTVWGYPFFGFGADVVFIDHSHFRFHHHGPFMHGAYMHGASMRRHH